MVSAISVRKTIQMTMPMLIEHSLARVALLATIIAGSYFSGGAEKSLTNLPWAIGIFLFLMLPIIRVLHATYQLWPVVVYFLTVTAWLVMVLDSCRGEVSPSQWYLPGAFLPMFVLPAIVRDLYAKGKLWPTIARVLGITTWLVPVIYLLRYYLTRL